MNCEAWARVVLSTEVEGSCLWSRCLHGASVLLEKGQQERPFERVGEGSTEGLRVSGLLVGVAC